MGDKKSVSHCRNPALSRNFSLTMPLGKIELAKSQMLLINTSLPCPHVQFWWPLGPRFLVLVSAS